MRKINLYPVLVTLLAVLFSLCLIVFSERHLVALLAVLFTLYLTVFGVSYFKKLLCSVLFLLPFLPDWAGLQISSGAPLLNASKVLLFIVVGLWVSKKLLSRESLFPRTPWAYAILILAGLQSLSLVISPHRQVSIIALIAYIGYYYLLYFCIYDSFRSIHEIRTLMLIVAIAGTLASAEAIYEAKTGYNLWHRKNWMQLHESARDFGGGQYGFDRVRYGFARAAGAFGNYLALGMFLGLAWPLWLVFYAPKPLFPKRVGVLALVLFGFFATWAPISRGAILGTVTASLIGLLIFGKKLMKIGIGVLVIVAILVALLIIPALVKSLVEGVRLFWRDSFYQGYAANFYARIEVIPYDIEGILHRPLTGYGVGMVTRAYQTGSSFSSFENAVRNYYLSLALESGIPALLAFLYLLFGSLIDFCRRARQCSEPVLKRMYIAISISIMSIAVALLSINMVETFYYLFALLAMGHRLARIEDSSCKVQTVIGEMA